MSDPTRIPLNVTRAQYDEVLRRVREGQTVELTLGGRVCAVVGPAPGARRPWGTPKADGVAAIRPQEVPMPPREAGDDP